MSIFQQRFEPEYSDLRYMHCRSLSLLTEDHSTHLTVHSTRHTSNPDLSGPYYSTSYIHLYLGGFLPA